LRISQQAGSSTGRCKEVLEAPTGFAQFAERFKHYQKLFDIEWPAVNVEYRDVCVSTQVGQNQLPG